MATDGSTRLEIVRTSGSADSTTHRIDLTTTADTSAGAKNKTIDLNSLSLISGTIYQIRLVGNDAAGNAATAQTISSIGYDAVGPSAPVLSATTTLFGTLTPLLSWAAAVDNGGNGSGLKSYTLTVYSGNSCTPSAVRTYNNIDPLALSYTLATALPTDKSTYSWTLQAIDNLDNTGSVSTCGAFSVDTSVPVISNATLKDTILNSSSWGKIGNTITLTANIANTDASHIWADLSLLTGNGGDTHVACSAPGAGITCSYVAGVVTYSFTIGSVTQNVSRIATLAAQNTVGINDTSANASITIDSTAPGITASTITSPNGGEIW